MKGMATSDVGCVKGKKTSHSSEKENNEDKKEAQGGLAKTEGQRPPLQGSREEKKATLLTRIH